MRIYQIKIILKIFLILDLLNKKYKFPILVSTHPGTKKAISKIKKKITLKIYFFKPFSFREYISLQINAKLVISDSGSITEESSIFKIKFYISKKYF